MRRRDFLASLASAITVWPAHAEESRKVHHVAIVSPATPASEITEAGSSPYRTFLSELRHSGYVEGQNLQVRRYSGEDGGEYRSDVRVTERFAALATEVVHGEPDVIFVEERILAHQVRAVTGTIPIVAIVPDPIADGLIRSLAHPGGNITGSTISAGAGIWGKRLEFLRELVPSVSKVGYLAPYSLSKTPYTQAIREAAHKLNVGQIPPSLEPPFGTAQYREAFSAMIEKGANAVIVSDWPEHIRNSRLIVELAEQMRLPAVYPYAEFVENGGLLAYGIDLKDVYRHAARQVGEILSGTNPGEIPFYQPTKFELTINAKAATTLGLSIPRTLLARADEVIE